MRSVNIGKPMPPTVTSPSMSLELDGTICDVIIQADN